MNIRTGRQFIGGRRRRWPPRRFPMPALAQAKPKVVVIGGGPGGATRREIRRQGSAAHRRDAGRAGAGSSPPASTPISISAASATCKSITHSYDKLAKSLRHQARACRWRRRSTARRRRCGSPTARRCPTTGWWSRPASTSSSTPCPAIRKRPAEVMPHAWKPGAQTQLLKQPAQRAEGRRDHRDDRAAQSVSLPAGPLRARVDDGACAQDEGPQEIADHHPRSEAELLQAGPVHRRLGEALSRHGRVAGPEDARRHQGRRRQDR